MDADRTQREKDLEKIRSFRLMDDDFMTRVFDEDTESIQFILRIIMDKTDLVVNSVKTQYEVHNLRGKSARLDVFAGDSTGRLFNIEIQRADKGAGRKRENDVFRKGLPIYHIERVIVEVNEQFNDGEHIVYVNGQNNDLDTELGKLMHDFREPDPDRMIYPVLARKSRYFKESEEGVAVVSKIMEDMQKEAANEAVLNYQKADIAKKLKKKWSPEQICAYDEYPMDLILEVQRELLLATH